VGLGGEGEGGKRGSEWGWIEGMRNRGIGNEIGKKEKRTIAILQAHQHHATAAIHTPEYPTVHSHNFP
jgi:hypothetical protein